MNKWIDLGMIIIHMVFLLFFIKGKKLENYYKSIHTIWHSKQLELYYQKKETWYLKRPFIYLVVSLYGILLLSTILLIIRLRNASANPFFLFRYKNLRIFLQYQFPFLGFIFLIVYFSYFFEYYYLLSKECFYYAKWFILHCILLINHLLLLRKITSFLIFSYILFIIWFLHMLYLFFNKKETFSNINFLWQFISILWMIFLFITSIFYLFSKLGGVV